MFYYALVFVLEVTKAGQPVVMFVDSYEHQVQCLNAATDARKLVAEDKRDKIFCKLMIDESKLQEI